MPDFVTTIALLLVLVLAAWQDVIKSRISNALIVGALAAGLLAQSVLGGFSGLLFALAGAGVGLACLLPFYLVKGMAAGDVKLMAAVGAFLGPGNAFLAAALTLVAGAALALVFVAWRLAKSRIAMADSNSGYGAAAMSFTAISGLRKERFPYAVAIGLGVIVTLWLKGALDNLLHGMGLG